MSVFAACEDATVEEESAAEEGSATLDAVTEAPRFFMGDQVTLSGEVDDVYTASSFELEDDEDWFFEEDIPVVTRSPISFAGESLTEEDEVIVSGTVRKLVVAEVERELGWDLDPEIETEWEGRPIVIADSVRKVHEYARWSEDEAKEGLHVGVASVTLIPDAADLVGDTLVLENVPVHRAAGDGLWVGYNTGGLFVVPPEGKKVDISEADRIDARGTLQKMPAESEAASKWNLDEAASQKLAEQTVYLEAEALSRAPRDQKQAKAEAP